MSTSDTDSPASSPVDAMTVVDCENDARWTITGSASPLATFGPLEQPELSIITVTFGVTPAQPQAWQALGESAADTSNAEMIVVDNPHPLWGHAGGDLVSICSRGVRLGRPDENLGFGGGNNLGVERARSDIICLLNPDVIVAPGDLSRLATVARDHPGDIIAPVLVNDDGSVQEMGGRISSDGTTRPIRTAKGSTTAEPDYASAACWVMHRDRFIELGGFDPMFFPAYYEDVDFALRLQQQGGRTIIDHTTQVVHAWAPNHLRVVPDTRPQHRLLRERWADELATRPTLRKPRAASNHPKTKRSSPSSAAPQ